MDWASIVTNVGFPIATAIGLAWFTKDRLDKSEAQWSARAAEWKDEKKMLIDRLILVQDKMETKLSQIATETRETVDRSTRVMEECLRVMKDIKKT